MPAFQPYRGKPAVRNDGEGRGNVGIIRSPVRASTLPDCGGRAMKRTSLPLQRREFIGLVGGAVAWPHTASAQQQGKIVTIGILAIEPWPPIDTFRRALHDLGYIEGKNVRFEYRYARGDNERLPELASELIGLNVDV